MPDPESIPFACDNHAWQSCLLCVIWPCLQQVSDWREAALAWQGATWEQQGSSAATMACVLSLSLVRAKGSRSRYDQLSCQFWNALGCLASRWQQRDCFISVRCLLHCWTYYFSNLLPGNLVGDRLIVLLAHLPPPPTHNASNSSTNTNVSPPISCSGIVSMGLFPKCITLTLQPGAFMPWPVCSCDSYRFLSALSRPGWRMIGGCHSNKVQYQEASETHRARERFNWQGAWLMRVARRSKCLDSKGHLVTWCSPYVTSPPPISAQGASACRLIKETLWLPGNQSECSLVVACPIVEMPPNKQAK